MAFPGMANLARKYRGELNGNMSVMRSERYSAYRQFCERPTVLSQMLWPGMPDFHGALCAYTGGRSVAPGVRYRPGSVQHRRLHQVRTM